MNVTPYYDLIIRYSNQINFNLDGYIESMKQWNSVNKNRNYCFVYRFINFDNATTDPSQQHDINVTNHMINDIRRGIYSPSLTQSYLQLVQMVINIELIKKILNSIPEAFDARPRIKCFYFYFTDEFKENYLLHTGGQSSATGEQLCNNEIISKVRTNNFESQFL
tara:strand:- start:21688 stop:22182 length:495 start_codon:yes stop_codon:yes gene_type:complete